MTSSNSSAVVDLASRPLPLPFLVLTCRWPAKQHAQDFQLLLGTDHLNEGLSWSGSRPFLSGKPLAAYEERAQLFFKAEGCTNITHYRLMTPKAVSSGANMKCCFCEQPPVWETEAVMGKALQDARLDGITTWQYQPKWLPSGRADFYMFTTGVVVQVDGTAHTQGMFKASKLSCSMQKDLRFNVTAWQAGAKVVRVLYSDLGHPELLDQLQLLAGVGGRCAGPLLLLSPGYRDLRCQDPSTQQRTYYIDWFRDAISGCCSLQRSSEGWTWLLPPTL